MVLVRMLAVLLIVAGIVGVIVRIRQQEWLLLPAQMLGFATGILLWREPEILTSPRAWLREHSQRGK